jgi:signal transduction histidine kinase
MSADLRIIFERDVLGSVPGSSVALLAGLSLLACVGAGLCVWQERRFRRAKADFQKLRKDFTSANERAAGSKGEKTQVLRIALQSIGVPLKELRDDVERLAGAKGELSGDLQSTVARLQSEYARITDALRALEDLATLETRSRSLNLVPLNVGAVLLEAVAHVRSAADSRQVRVSVPAPTKTSTVLADADVLRRALENLLLDAIEVTPGRGTVTVSLFQAPDRVLVTVADEGPGTVVQDQATLLDQSGHSRPPLQAGNARLNLAMVHNLVKAMDGWLWSQGEPGRGTTHVIELPTARSGS